MLIQAVVAPKGMEREVRDGHCLNCRRVKVLHVPYSDVNIMICPAAAINHSVIYNVNLELKSCHRKRTAKSWAS